MKEGFDSPRDRHMKYYVYLLVNKNRKKIISYVGYTKDLNKRLLLHNSSKGAKFTKGNYWKIVYQKKYNSKSEAMKAEYNLKKNYRYRSKLKNKFINDENINITSI